MALYGRVRVLGGVRGRRPGPGHPRVGVAAGAGRAVASRHAASDATEGEHPATANGSGHGERTRVGVVMASTGGLLVECRRERRRSGGVVAFGEAHLLGGVERFALGHERPGGAFDHGDLLLLARGERQRVHKVAKGQTNRCPALRHVDDVAERQG